MSSNGQRPVTMWAAPEGRSGSDETYSLQLIAIAGGLTEYAEKRDIKIFRMEGNTARPISFNYETFTDGSNPKQNIELRPSDVVDVP